MSFEPRLYCNEGADDWFSFQSVDCEEQLPDELQALAEQLIEDASHLAGLYPAAIDNIDSLDACSINARQHRAVAMTPTETPQISPHAATRMVSLGTTTAWKVAAALAAGLLIAVVFWKPVTNTLFPINRDSAIANHDVTAANQGLKSPALARGSLSPSNVIGADSSTGSNNPARQIASGSVENIATDFPISTGRETPPANVLEGLSASEQEAVLDLLEQRMTQDRAFVGGPKGLSI